MGFLSFITVKKIVNTLKRQAPPTGLAAADSDQPGHKTQRGNVFIFKWNWFLAISVYSVETGFKLARIVIDGKCVADIKDAAWDLAVP